MSADNNTTTTNGNSYTATTSSKRQYCQNYSCQYITACSIQLHRSAKWVPILALSISSLVLCVFRHCSVHRCVGDHDSHQAYPVIHVKWPVVGGRGVDSGTFVKVSQQQARPFRWPLNELHLCRTGGEPSDTGKVSAAVLLCSGWCLLE